MLCRFWVVTALLALCAVPLVAQGKTGKAKGKGGATAEQPPPKEVLNEAYYIVKHGGKDVGFGIMKVDTDPAGNLQLGFNGSANVDTVVAVDVEVPPSKSAEVARIDYSDVVTLDPQGKLSAYSSSRGSATLTATYQQGRWELAVKRGLETKSGTTPESPACDPPIPHLFYLLAKQKAYKPNSEVKKQIFDLMGESLVGQKECTIVVSASEKRVAFDGEERLFSKLMVQIKRATDEGKPPYSSTVWVGEDGFIDELAYDGGRITFKRVKDKEALGAAAGWADKGRRDVFEKDLTVPPGAPVTKDKGGSNPDAPFVVEIAKIEAKIVVLAGEKNLKAQVKMSQEILKDIAQSLDRKPPDPSKKKLNEAKAKVILLVPPHALALGEATTLRDGIFESLREGGGQKGVEDAKKRLVELRALQLGPRLRGTPSEGEAFALVSDCAKAIGSSVLKDYVRDVVVKGIIYRRSDEMEPVTVHLSILGAPVLLDDTIPVLHPRGLCLLNDEAYREGDPVLKLGKSQFAITVKEVFQDRVVLAGEDAEVDLKFTTEREGGGKAPVKSVRPR